MPPSGAGRRAENIERTPRVPSTSCTSVTKPRSFSTDSRASSDWPLTTIRTSYSLDGKSRETCSNCLNAGSSERNNWFNELSVLMRWIPRMARTAIASAARTVAVGALKGMSARRSIPSAMLRTRSGGSAVRASGSTTFKSELLERLDPPFPPQAAKRSDSTSRNGRGRRPERRSTSPVMMSNAPAAVARLMSTIALTTCSGKSPPGAARPGDLQTQGLASPAVAALRDDRRDHSALALEACDQS